MTLRGLTWDHPRGYGPLEAIGGATWHRQPLEDFEARPLRDVAAHYDLVVLDHPGLGDAIADEALRPLDDLFDAAELGTWRMTTVGASFDSYTLDGRQWALPIDAAAQVSVTTLPVRPGTWDEAIAVAAAHPTTLCLGGPHAYLMHAALVQAFDDDEKAFDVLAELFGHADRELSLRSPIGVLDAMTRPGGPVFCPLVFAYNTYPALRFVDAPHGPTGIGSVLGGTGVAVTRSCRDLDSARELIRRLMGSEYAEHGGQSARRGAWPLPDTTATIEHASVRPRHPGFVAYQARTSAAIRDGLLAGTPSRRILDAIRRIS